MIFHKYLDVYVQHHLLTLRYLYTYVVGTAFTRTVSIIWLFVHTPAIQKLQLQLECVQVQGYDPYDTFNVIFDGNDKTKKNAIESK